MYEEEGLSETTTTTNQPAIKINLGGLMPIYEYQGQNYDLKEGLSNAEAKEKNS